jgi:hypothetical protein
VCQSINILGFLGKLCVATIKLSLKAAIENSSINKHSCVPIKLYL